jgi:hypothetical protein
MKKFFKGAKSIAVLSFDFKAAAENALGVEEMTLIQEDLDSLPASFIPLDLASPLASSAGVSRSGDPLQPVSPLASSTGVSRSGGPLQTPNPTRTTSLKGQPYPGGTLPRHKVSHKHSRERAKKKRRVEHDSYKPSKSTIWDIINEASYKHLESVLADEEFEWVQTGYTGLPKGRGDYIDGVDESSLTLEKLIEMGFCLVKWDGR